MRKTMIALAAAFAVCTATMTSGATAAFARGGGSFWRGAHGFGGGGFGGHGFAVGRGDIGHFGGRVRRPWLRFWRPTLRSIWIWPLWIRGRVLLRLRLWGLCGAPSVRLCLDLLLTSNTEIS
jgi:hypothetical protein